MKSESAPIRLARRTLMTEESSFIPEESAPAIPQNPAIVRARAIAKRAYNAALEKGKETYYATKDANQAYRRAMPPLTGQENISNFIACVAHGILIDAIDGRDATRLLYAAQVALATVRNQPSPPKEATV
jgi:hypothetical protein